MDFTCERQALTDGVSTVERAVSTREAVSILNGVLLDVAPGRLRLLATDLEIAIECHLALQAWQEGATVVEGRYLSQIVRRLPGEDVRFERPEGAGAARIVSGRAAFQIQCREPGEFPALPAVEGRAAWQVPAGLLRDMIRQTAFAAATDDGRPFLTGVLVELDGTELRLVATDSHRMAFRRAPLNGGEPQGTQVIVPARTMHELSRLLPAGSQEPVHVSVGENQVRFAAGDVRLVSRLLEGRFPNYSHVFPKDQPVRIRVEREALLAAVERAALIARKGPAYVRLRVGEGRLSVTAQEPDVGSAHEDLQVTSEGEEGETAYQARFLVDVLRNLDAEMIRLEWAPGEKPALLQPVEDESYKYIVMPVRIT